MEKAYFPMDYYRLTQGYGKKSSGHKTKYALDVGGRDTGIDKVYAPFTGVIKKIIRRTKNANSVCLESLEPVLCANGEITYLTILLAHDNNIDNLKIGQIVKQGEHFFDEGRSGNATGNHLHIELSNKKYSENGTSKNSSGAWVINNPVKPEEYLFLKKDQVVLNDTYKNEKYSMKVDNEDLSYDYKKELTEFINKYSTINKNDLREIAKWCTDKAN